MRHESTWENGSVASCILYLGTTREWEVSSRLFYLWEKNALYSLNRNLLGLERVWNLCDDNSLASAEKWITLCVIRTNKMHYFLLIYFSNHPLPVSNRLTIHHQKVVYCIYSKHVEGDYWNKLREKSSSCWSLLRKYIMMHGPQNVKLNHDCAYIQHGP